MGTTKVPAAMLGPDAQTQLPTTTRGDLVVDDGNISQRLPAGADGEVLHADSNAALGLTWKPVTFSRIVGEVSDFALAAPPSGWLACDGAAVSRNTYAALFAALGTTWGAGDGVTTFNVPDQRGRGRIGVGTGSKGYGISAVNASSDQLTIPANNALHTGQAVVYTSAGAAAGGLVSGDTYYVIRANADGSLVSLASSRANAVAGVVIDLTSTGSGVQTLTKTLTARSLGEVGGEEGHTATIGEMPSHTHAASSAGFFFAQNSPTGTQVQLAGSTSGATGGSGEHQQMPPYGAFLTCIYAGV